MKIRVIGFGPEVADIVKTVDSQAIESIETQVVEPGESVEVHQDDKMAIFLAENTKGIEPLIHRFYEAGVLTLVVCTQDEGLPEDIFDGFTVQPRERFAEVVDSLIYPLFHDYRVCLVFDDLEDVLHNCGRFYVGSGVAQGEHRCNDALQLAVSQLNVDLQTLRNMNLVQTFNPEIQPRFTMGEMTAITDFVASLDTSLELVYGFYHDSEMDTESVRTILISSR